MRGFAATAVERFAVAGGQHDVSAGRRDRLRGGGPDPAAGAGHERDPPGQPVRRLSPRLATSDLPVEALVGVEAQLEVEVRFRRARGMPAAKSRPLA